MESLSGSEFLNENYLIDHDFTNKRISKACDQCRSKKIKCDGLPVCSKCASKGLGCTYLYVHKQKPKKDLNIVTKTKRKRGRPKKGSSKQHLRMDMDDNDSIPFIVEKEDDSEDPLTINRSFDNRLSKMEEMMNVLLTKFTDRLSPQSVQSNLLEDLNPRYNHSGTITCSPNSTTSGMLNTKSTMCSRTEAKEHKTHFFAPELLIQTSLFILSPNGIKSIETKLKNPQIVEPLTAVIKFAIPFEKTSLSEWIDPIDENQLQPLPSREVINLFCSKMVSSVFIDNVVDIKYVISLLEDYCNYRDHLIAEPNFSYSDIFLMNVSLLASCSTIIELINLDASNYVSMLSLDEIRTIEKNLFNNSLFYYHKISVISHDLSSVSACSLLSFYADASSISRASYLIGSTASRLAQQLGLHREESYRGLSSSEKCLRIKVWWTVYAADKESCFRWGHPPVINDDDVSAPLLPGMEQFSSFGEIGKLKAREIKLKEIQQMLKGIFDGSAPIGPADLYIVTDYSVILSNVYNKLLSARAMIDKSSKEMIEIRDELLHDLEVWKEALPYGLRPSSKYSSEFKAKLAEIKEQANDENTIWIFMTSCNIVRYHHLRMVISRTVAHFLEPKNVKLAEESFNAGTEEARSVLEIACLVDSGFGSFATYLIFYPLNAFMTLCVYHIFSKNTIPEVMEHDLLLMLRAFKNFFYPFSDSVGRNEKGYLFGAVVKCMLFITVTAAREKCSDLNLPKEFDEECEKIFDPIRSYMSRNITIDELVMTVQNKIRLISVGIRDSVKFPVNFSEPKTDSVPPSHTDLSQPPPSDFFKNENGNSQTMQNDFSVASMLNGSDNRAVNNWTTDGSDFLLQNILNVPNYLLDYGSDSYS